MKNLIKRALAGVLLVVLVFMFVACGGNDDPPAVAGDGSIDLNTLTKYYRVDVWKDDGYNLQSKTSIEGVGQGKNGSAEEFATAVKEWNRVQMFYFTVLNSDALNGKAITKISFTVEADRAVTTTIAAVNTITEEKISEQTFAFTANEPQTVTFTFTDEFQIKRGQNAIPDFQFRRLAGKDYELSYGADNPAAQSVWSQTQYKITNLKVFCE